MKYKLYALLLTLTLTASPALQAMRTRGAFLATARSFRNPTLLAGRQIVTRAQSTNNNEQGHGQEESRYARETNYLPATAIAIGAGLTTQRALEEQEDSLTINKLDIYDINAVLEVFKNGTENEKRELAQRIAQKITHYKIEDVIKMLLQTEKRPHRTLVNALTKNITRYTPEQIAQILTGDTQDETHDLIASALNKNYNYFTGYTVGGYRLLANADYLYEYAKTINSLKEKYHSKAIEPLAHDLNENNIRDGLGWDIKNILKNAPTQSKQIIISAIIQNMNSDKEETLEAINWYVGIHTILKHSNEHNTEMITAFIVKNINNYSIDKISSILYASTDKNKKSIIAAIAQNINNGIGKHLNIFDAFKQKSIWNLETLLEILKTCNEQTQTTVTAIIINNIAQYSGSVISDILKVYTDKNERVIEAVVQNIREYDASNLHHILESCNAHNQEIITTAIAQTIAHNINKFTDAFYLLNILKISNEQNQELITNAIAQNIDIYTTSYDLRFFFELEILSPKNKEIIINGIIKKVDEFIGQHAIDYQSAAHLKENAVAAWEYIRTIANNPKYKIAFQQAMSHEHSTSGDSAVFYHSQKSPVYWLELLYTKLWEQKYNQKSTNYLFTRFPDDQNEFSNAVLQYDGQEKREELLKEGRNGLDELRPYLFFANYALFGNSTNWGSCSVHYFLKNFNVGDPDITTQNIIDKFGDKALFDRYKAEFEQLEKEFKEIVPNSVLLQLTIPHKALNEYVYLAAPGGYKKTLQISGEETENVSTIIKTLKTNPKAFNETDQHEFCVVMTPNTVHTLREQGAEVRVYGGFEQEKLDAFVAKLEALIARIAKKTLKRFRQS